MLVIPHGRDQNDNAIRVTERGAGLQLLPTAATAEIRAALKRLLAEPEYRLGAQRLGRLVAEDVWGSPIVPELEGLARARAPAPDALCA
jgi:UDP:flavonoid glycosyltransferase YjiC (YdhE family)